MNTIDYHQRNLELFEKWKAGDEDAYDELVQANMGLIVPAITRLLPTGHKNFNSAVSIGYEGLRKAIKLWDPTIANLSTYAKCRIQAGVIKEYMDNSHTIRRPIRVQGEQKRVEKAKLFLKQKLGRNPTTEEISEATGLRPDRIITISEGVVSVSIDTPIFEGTQTLHKIISGTILDPEKLAEIGDELREEIRRLQKLQGFVSSTYRRINPKTSDANSEIFAKRFGLFGCKKSYSVEELRKALNVSHQYVSKLVGRVFKEAKKKDFTIDSQEELDSTISRTLDMIGVVYSYYGRIPERVKGLISGHLSPPPQTISSENLLAAR